MFAYKVVKIMHNCNKMRVCPYPEIIRPYDRCPLWAHVSMATQLLSERSVDTWRPYGPYSKYRLISLTKYSENIFSHIDNDVKMIDRAKRGLIRSAGDHKNNERKINSRQMYVANRVRLSYV